MSHRPALPYILRHEPGNPEFLYTANLQDAIVHVASTYGHAATAHIVPYFTEIEVQRRYPRLLALCGRVAILSTGEAVACLRDHHNGYLFSGEAVNHFGGCAAVIRAAIAARHHHKRKPKSVTGIEAHKAN